MYQELFFYLIKWKRKETLRALDPAVSRPTQCGEVWRESSGGFRASGNSVREVTQRSGMKGYLVCPE